MTRKEATTKKRRKARINPSPRARSAEARRQAMKTRPREWERLLRYLRGCRRRGATDQEMQQAVRMGGNTQRPRRRELEQRGLVKNSGKQRKTLAGVRATVWVTCAAPRRSTRR